MIFGYVYRITNLINGKTYIGKHVPKPGEDWLSYMGSGVYIKKAIQKYGKESFLKEMVSKHYSQKELSIAENKLIASEMSNGKAEYNLYAKNIPGISNEDELHAVSLYVEELWTVDELCAKFTITKNRMLSILKTRNVLRTRVESQNLRFNKPEFISKECAYCEAVYQAPRNTRGKTCSRHCRGKLQFKGKENSLRKEVSKEKELLTFIRADEDLNGVQMGAKVATHMRWHVKRNKPNKACALCNPPL